MAALVNLIRTSHIPTADEFSEDDMDSQNDYDEVPNEDEEWMVSQSPKQGFNCVKLVFTNLFTQHSISADH